MSDTEFLFLAGAVLAGVSALCFFFPLLGSLVAFPLSDEGQVRGMAYVIAIISAFLLLMGLGRLAGLLH